MREKPTCLPIALAGSWSIRHLRIEWRCQLWEMNLSNNDVGVEKKQNQDLQVVKGMHLFLTIHSRHNSYPRFCNLSSNHSNTLCFRSCITPLASLPKIAFCFPLSRSYEWSTSVRQVAMGGQCVLLPRLNPTQREIRTSAGLSTFDAQPYVFIERGYCCLLPVFKPLKSQFLANGVAVLSVTCKFPAKRNSA